jgi:hypothetical protein
MQAGEDHAEEGKAMKATILCTVFSVHLAMYSLFGSLATCSQE